MSNNKKDAPDPKRPHATLDLKATDVTPAADAAATSNKDDVAAASAAAASASAKAAEEKTSAAATAADSKVAEGKTGDAGATSKSTAGPAGKAPVTPDARPAPVVRSGGWHCRRCASHWAG
jgi:uncharacterized low-complexity protein